jgi:hypothetical protein
VAGTIKISSDLDARGFLKGTSNMEDALEDVSKDLDKTGKEGVKDVEKLEKSFAEAAKSARDSGNTIQKSLGDGTKKGAKEAEDATEVYKKEAIANVSEVTSSFTGSWESAADAIQGTLGGVVADLGPIGAAAGAAGAIGIGLLTAQLVKAEEDAAKAKERVRQLGLAIIDSGESIATLEEINENIRLIVSDADDAPKKFKDIQKEAQYTGLDVNKLAAAYAGSADALDEVIKSAQEAYKAEQDLVVINGESQEVISEKEIALQGVIQALIGVQGQAKTAKEIEEAYYAVGGGEAAAKREAIESINAAYDDAAGSILDFKNEESGVLDVQAYIDSMVAREQALADYQDAVAESGFTTEQKAALNDMGIEASAAWMQGYKQASPAQQKEMEKILTKMASDSSGQAVKSMEKAFEKPVEAKVEAKVDMKMAQQDLDNLIKARSAIIKLDFRDRNGKKID